MKITQLSADWKEDVSIDDVCTALNAVGPGGHAYDYDQSTTDSKIMIFSSEELTQKQLDELWVIGDLWTEDQVWVGESFEDILKKIKAYVEELI